MNGIFKTLQALVAWPLSDDVSGTTLFLGAGLLIFSVKFALVYYALTHTDKEVSTDE